MNQYEYIIVGQGLAGSLLGLELIRKNKKILFIDNNYHNSSSRVAAGLFNPVTGRKMNLSWMAEKLFPFLHSYYPALEKELRARFFYPTPLFHLFGSVKEMNDLAEAGYGSWVDMEPEAHLPPQVKHPLGYMGIRQSGWCDVARLLQASRKHFLTYAAILEEEFDHAALSPEAGSWKYKDISCKAVLFCEGYKAIYNPWFSYLPFLPVKGDILEVKADLELHVMIKRRNWLIPLGEDRYRLGSTFDKEHMDERCTPEAEAYLSDRLQRMINCTFEISGHRAGIRPAVSDRRPLIGGHPQHEGLYIFNGLGAKGVSLSPWFSLHFVRHLLHGESLMPEVSISRWIRK